jgi:hypothetical protein
LHSTASRWSRSMASILEEVETCHGSLIVELVTRNHK